MAEVAEGLTVDAARMRRNIDATQGAVFAEKAMMLLAREDGARGRAPRGRREHSPDRLATGFAGLRMPEDYLGSAEAFRLRLLEGKG